MRDTRLPDPKLGWTEDDARQALEAQRQSGDSVAVFARTHGISRARLYYWRQRLATSSSTRSTLSLVPATVVAEEVAIAIRLPDGVAIEVANASSTWVAALVIELARLPR
jgi:transposase-like protein